MNPDVNGANAPSYPVLQQAASWYALLRSERVTEYDRSKWRHWHDLHAEHRHAWSLVERVGGRFGQFGDAVEKKGAMAALHDNSGPRLSRRRTLWSLGGLTLATWLGWRTLGGGVSVGSWLADYATHTGEQRQVQLPTGGQLWLNTASAMNMDGPRLKLISGEINIDDRLGHGGTLQLNTPNAEFDAKRARFNLRLGDAGLCLDVYAGIVEVACKGQRQTVQAGQQITVNRQGLGPSSPASEPHRAWVQGVLVADGTTLGQVIAELARYRHGYLACDPRIANLPVVGTFSIRDTDRALASLASALPVRVNRLLPWWVTLEARA